MTEFTTILIGLAVFAICAGLIITGIARDLDRYDD